MGGDFFKGLRVGLILSVVIWLAALWLALQIW